MATFYWLYMSKYSTTFVHTMKCNWLAIYECAVNINVVCIATCKMAKDDYVHNKPVCRLTSLMINLQCHSLLQG